MPECPHVRYFSKAVGEKLKNIIIRHGSNDGTG